jgi:hypothetical protein
MIIPYAIYILLYYIKVIRQFGCFSKKLLTRVGTHMPGGERRKPFDIEDRRTKVKVTTSKRY